MNPKSATLTRRMALSALVGATLLSALPAMALGRLSDVRVVNRDNDEVLPFYLHQGEYWVVGEPGARYVVELQNTTRLRVLHVVSVDGVNVVTGDTAAFDQPGYVLTPGQRYDVSGWRKSSQKIAAFEFTGLPRSYAARTGRPDDVGVIGVALFRESLPYREPHTDRGPLKRSAPAPSTELQGKSHGGAPGMRQELGTGHGEIERDRVGQTDFARRSSRPDEVIRIRYDSRENLVAMGVIPPERRRWRDRPSAFPGAQRGYVPDPY
jgi:hypothetical protein